MASRSVIPTGEAVSIGRILQRSFAVVAAAPRVVFGIAFLIGALPGLAMSVVIQQLNVDGSDVVLLSTPRGLITFGLSMLVHGALVRATAAQLDGRGASWQECLAAGVRTLLPLVGLSIVILIGVGFGFAVFFVPGIIIYIIWSVASPALVEEREGVFTALGRSRYLTKGARWKVFGLHLIILMVYWMTVGTIGFGAIADGGDIDAVVSAGGLPVVWLIASTAITTLTTTFWSTTQTALYVELRDWKDGPSADRLADVFA